MKYATNADACKDNVYPCELIKGTDIDSGLDDPFHGEVEIVWVMPGDDEETGTCLHCYVQLSEEGSELD